MKRLGKLIIFLSLCPLLLFAKTSEEVKYRFYKEVEDNIHFERDVEHNCEFFDNNDFIYSDIISTTSKPEEKDERIVTEEIKEISLSRDIITKLEINYFYVKRINKKIYEIEFYDGENNKLSYDIENAKFVSGLTEYINDEDLESYVVVDQSSKASILFQDVVDIKTLKIKVVYENDDNTFYGLVYIGYVNNIYADAYDYNSVNKEITCDDEMCFMSMELKDKTPSERDLKVKTKVYNYKDKMYKCYSLNKVYVPGYYTELDGFVKDEEKYIIEKVEDNSEEKETIKNEISLLNENNQNVLKQIEKLNSNDIINKIDDLSLNLNNKDDSNIINEINNSNKKLSEKNDSNYLEIVNELKRTNITNEDKLNNLEGLINNLKIDNKKINKDENKDYISLYLIIISALELITLLLLLIIPNIIVKKSRTK